MRIRIWHINEFLHHIFLGSPQECWDDPRKLSLTYFEVETLHRFSQPLRTERGRQAQAPGG